MCCADFIAKYVLFITNFVFSLAGLTILGLGIAVWVQVKDVQDILPIDLVPISLIVLGSIVFVIAFLACCGAIRESRCMLITYSVFMMVLAGLKIYLSVVIFDYLTAIEEAVSDWLTSAFENTNLRPAYHVLEQLFRCCGTVGPSSYGDQPLPPTCCATPLNNTCAVTDTFGGCTTLVSEYFNTFGEATGAVLIIIVIIEVVLIVLACFFQRSISKKSGQVA